jgi:antitoxin MazE
MRAKIVRIGNSRGIRIPKAVLDECGIQDSVELSITDGGITLRAAQNPRDGWLDAAREMVATDEDALIDPPIPTKFDDTEWEW